MKKHQAHSQRPKASIHYETLRKEANKSAGLNAGFKLIDTIGLRYAITLRELVARAARTKRK